MKAFNTILIVGFLALDLFSEAVLSAADVLVDPSSWNSSRTTGTNGGIQAAEKWSGSGNNGFKISWNITLNGGLFHYVYSITDSKNGDLARNLSHIIIQFSQTFTPNDFLNSAGKPVAGIELKNYSSTLQGNSNPSMPGVLYGISFPGSSGKLTIDFYTNRAPVWGSFYAKGGNSAVAWNTGFTSSSTGPGANIRNFSNWIARPDSAIANSVAIPEPMTMTIMGTSLAAIYVARRKMKKQI